MQQHEQIDPDKPFLTPKLRKEIWKKRIDKMSDKAKEISASQWAVPVLLIALLGYNIYDSNLKTEQLTEFKIESQKQHDLLVELRTIKEMEDKAKAQEKIDKKLDKDQDDVWRQSIQRSMNRLELIVQGKYPNTPNTSETKEN